MILDKHFTWHAYLAMIETMTMRHSSLSRGGDAQRVVRDVIAAMYPLDFDHV